MAQFGSQLLGAAAQSLPGFALGGIQAAGQYGLNSLAAKQSFEYSKRLMALQNSYQRQAFERENERQDYLLANQYAINRNSLKAAGYSAANPDGVSLSPPSVNNQDSPTHSQFGVESTKLDLMSGAMLSKLNAETKKIEADTDKTKTDNEVAQEQLKALKETLPERIGQIKSEYYKVTKENRHIDAMVDNLEESTRQMSITNDFNEKTFNDRANSIAQELRKLSADASVSEAMAVIKSVEKQLAEAGVLVGNNWVNTLISLAALGKGKEATGAVADFVEDIITEVIASIPEILGSTVGSFANGILGLPGKTLRAVRRKWKELTSDE